MGRVDKTTIHLFLVVAGIVLCTFQQSAGQSIHFGMSADSVQLLVADEVQGHYDAGQWLTKLRAETREYKGQVVEVLLFKENILMRQFEKGAKFCIHYVMQQGRLAAIITQYENLTLEEVKILIMPGRSNVGGYYFTSNYQFFSKVYIAANGLVTDEYQPANSRNVPYSIQEQVRALNMKFGNR